MKLDNTLPPDDNDDEEDDALPLDPPPSDELLAAQQKHRRAERLALLEALLAYLQSRDALTLQKLRLRWETGIINQLHIGKWSTIWPLLDAAMHIPGFCSGGVVVLGGWHASPPRDAEDLAEVPAELLDLLLAFRVYCITLEMVANLKASATVGEFRDNDAALARWIEENRKWLGLFKWDPDDTGAIERLAKQAVEEFPTLIHNVLLNLQRRVFVFLPLPEDTSAGWRGLHEFGDAYRRLPSHIITEFGDYFFEVRIPTAGS